MYEALIDYNKLNNKNWLKLQYIDNQRSTTNISKECQCSPALVSKKLKIYNILSRTVSESMKLISSEISKRGKANWKNLEYKYKTSKAISKVIQSNPDIKKKMIDGAINRWSTNAGRAELRQRWVDGLYNNRPEPTIETRQKLSKSTSRLWKNQNYRDNAVKRISESVIRAIEEGRIEMTNSSMCGYYDSSKIGQVYLKSRWEFEIAIALDASNFKWKYEFERVKYDLDNKSHIYLPDFKIINNQNFVVIETKRSDWRKHIKECAKNNAGKKRFGKKYILIDCKSKLRRMIKSIESNQWPL